MGVKTIGAFDNPDPYSRADVVKIGEYAVGLGFDNSKETLYIHKVKEGEQTTITPIKGKSSVLLCRG